MNNFPNSIRWYIMKVLFVFVFKAILYVISVYSSGGAVTCVCMTNIFYNFASWKDI